MLRGSPVATFVLSVPIVVATPALGRAANLGMARSSVQRTTGRSVAAGGGATGQAGPTGPSPARTGALPWLRYQTDVSPDPGLALLGAERGWMIAGHGTHPSIDHFLSAAGGASWPGDGVLVTADGGRHWSQVLHVPTGVWGLDELPSSGSAFAVGVTEPFATGDGGRRWQLRGEPADQPLVEVSFSSTISGIGLTTDGQLVTTSDGGWRWTADAGSDHLPLTSSCAIGIGRYLVSSSAGSIWLLAANKLRRVFDARLPSSVSPGNARPFGGSMQANVGAPVSYLSCSPGLDAEAVSWPVGSASANGFGGVQSMLFATSGPGGAWEAVTEAGSASQTWSITTLTPTTAAYPGVAVR
ncbi:MAG TPA: hypothetical protein VMD59_18070, partial [Acidimicrobiales bacterium]|nr:hypothetical protein [Acidimicrobiales bacterium]